MSHTDLILIISIIGISSTVGVYVIIRFVKQYTRTPENLLQRRGDIELDNFIEPTQPAQVYYPSGLESLQSQPNSLIRTMPVERLQSLDLESNNLIQSAQVDRLNTITELDYISQLESIPLVERLQSDSLKFQPTDYYFEDLYISSCLENESSFDIILIILIFLFWFWFFKKF